MAQYHYDLTGSEPIIRDTRVYSVSGTDLYQGEVMAIGAIATGENGAAAIKAPATTLANVIGVMNEDLLGDANHVSVVATGVDKWGKIIINPYAVWLCKYSRLAADILTTNAADATGKALTVAAIVTNHFRSWNYVISGTGQGNLTQVGAITGTTVNTAATSYDDYLAPVAIGDTFINTHAPYMADVAGGSVNLAANCIDVAGHDATASAGAAIVLENYIMSPSRPLEVLRCEKHSSNNYKTENPNLYADVFFVEHLLVSGGVVNNRIIT